MNIAAFCLHWKLISNEIHEVKWCKINSECAPLRAYIDLGLKNRQLVLQRDLLHLNVIRTWCWFRGLHVEHFGLSQTKPLTTYIPKAEMLWSAFKIKHSCLRRILTRIWTHSGSALFSYLLNMAGTNFVAASLAYCWAEFSFSLTDIYKVSSGVSVPGECCGSAYTFSELLIPHNFLFISMVFKWVFWNHDCVRIWNGKTVWIKIITFFLSTLHRPLQAEKHYYY